MTTRNVSSSCEVLWVSRQDNIAIDAFFKNSVDAVTSIPGVFQTLVNYGALWMAARGGNVTLSEPSGNYFYPPDAGYSDIVQASWSKDLTSPAGVFSLQVKPRVDWDRYVKPGDIVVIFMDNDHQFGVDTRTDGTIITIGIIDRVARSTTVDNNGATVENIAINGRDLGMIFQETQTVYDPTFGQVLDQEYLNAKYIQQTSQDNVIALSPVETVYYLLDLIYNQNATGSELVGAQWALPNLPQNATGRPVSLLSMLDIASFTQRPMFGYAITQPFGVAQAGNVWTLLESYANRTINEFFVDMRDITDADITSIQFQGSQAFNVVPEDDFRRQSELANRLLQTGVFNQSTLQFSQSDPSKPDQVAPVMALVHRQTPYDRDAFMNLPVHEIDHTEVFDFEIGASAHEVANFFEVHFPDIQEASQELMWGIKLNVQSIMRFGIRRFEAETRFPFLSSELSTSFSQGAQTDLTQSFAYYVGLLATWYATNETLLNGSMALRFRPEIRVGHRIRYRRVDGQFLNFYVQALNQSFSVSPGGSRTSLTLVRGAIEDQNALANNLIWVPNDGDDGEQIPDALLKYVRVKRFGVDSK